MPTLNQTKTGGVISFGAQDWLSGLYPQYQTTINATPGFISDQLLLERAFNPYRYLGYAAPGFSATDLTNVSVVTGLLRNVCFGNESSTNYAYAIGNNNLLHRIDISNKTLSNAGSWPHTITTGVVGTAEGNDCITYSFNVGGTTPADKRTGIFYSWNDTTASNEWNVGVFNTVAGTFTDNFMTTVPASPLAPVANENTKPHPMIVGPDDLLYIGDGNLLHSYDGSTGNNGTFESTRLRLPAGYLITSFAKLPDYLVIYAYYSPSGQSVSLNQVTSGPAIAVLWNYLDLDATYIVPLGDNTVSAGFEYQGTVGCFTQGTKPVQEGENRFCTLQLWNGGSFEVVSQFIGNPPIHGGIDIVDKSIQWNSDGILHCFGSPYLGTPEGLNKIGEGSGVSGSYPGNTGVLRTIGGITGFQLMSSGTTTSGGAQYFKIGTFGAAAQVQTSAVTPFLPPTTIAKIVRISVKFGKVSNVGRDLSASLVRENGETIQFISGLQDVAATGMTTFYDRTVSGGMFGRFQELSLSLSWGAGADDTDAPVVRTVDVEYELQNLVAS